MLVRLCFIAALALVVHCLYNADSIDWNRHAYLVKVISRDIKLKNVSTCTGTLVSESTVVTSSRCFQGNVENIEAQAIIPILGSKKTMHKAMLEVRVDNDIAVMRIDPIDGRSICEGAPYPPRISQLNMRSSLTDASFKTIDPKKIEEMRCRVIGFETMEDGNDFAKSSSAQALEIDVRKESETMMFTEVNGNSTGSACWDDIGAPLECTLNEEDVWVQIGFVHSIFGRANEDGESVQNATCADVNAMKFYVFSDSTLPHNLEIVDKSGVFHAQDKCF